jgi:hypothetical protein
VVGDEDVVKGFGGIRGFPATFLVDRHGRIYKNYLVRDFLDWARLISCNWDHLAWSPAEPQATILTVSISSRQACVL